MSLKVKSDQRPILPMPGTNFHALRAVFIMSRSDQFLPLDGVPMPFAHQFAPLDVFIMPRSDNNLAMPCFIMPPLHQHPLACSPAAMPIAMPHLALLVTIRDPNLLAHIPHHRLAPNAIA